jgi:hypothetical protein
MAIMRNFIILIGGPGRFQSCDKQHDQTWRNYLVPPQLAAMRNSYNRAPDEKTHWVVYMSPYEFRWDDDSTITKAEKKQSDGAWLHGIRKKAADKVRSTGATNCLNRIQMMASGLGITYKGIRTPQDFWDHLASFSKESISRVWYFGHAGDRGLMLALTHDAYCRPIAYEKDMILTIDLAKQSHLANRFDPKTTQASRFYGCYTNNFAIKWHNEFKVPAEGAQQKIDFGVVDRSSGIPCILERIIKTPTSEGDPSWTRH